MHDNKTRKAKNKGFMLRFMPKNLHRNPAADSSANNSSYPQPLLTDTPNMRSGSPLINRHPAKQQQVNDNQIKTKKQPHIILSLFIQKAAIK
jgi:hypothetical protein